MNLEYLDEVYADVDERIDNILTLGDVNEELVKIAVNNLKSLRTDVAATGRNLGVLHKIDTQLTVYDQITLIPQLTTKFPIIREQSIVLIIGTLEVFAADVFRRIGNNDPKLYVWNDPKEKILVEPTLISEDFTLGDAILSHIKLRGTSFQDLQSFLRALQTYLSVDIEMSADERDALILAAAYRNVIVHNRSVIDDGLLKQVRDTRYASEFGEKKGEKIDVKNEFLDQLAAYAKELCIKVVAALKERAEA